LRWAAKWDAASFPRRPAISTVPDATAATPGGVVSSMRASTRCDGPRTQGSHWATALVPAPVVNARGSAAAEGELRRKRTPPLLPWTR
jgi:hypothetical protein